MVSVAHGIAYRAPMGNVNYSQANALYFSIWSGSTLSSLLESLEWQLRTVQLRDDSGAKFCFVRKVVQICRAKRRMKRKNILEPGGLFESSC